MSAASKLLDLIGSRLVQGDREVPIASLQDKTVALYFSASWCPPCRQFTPQLVKFYNSNAGAKNLEIVFVSSDRDARSFQGYYSEMPWLAIPFSDRSRKDALSSVFKVSGIPALVILDMAAGTVLTTKGVDVLRRDPSGASFPLAVARGAVAAPTLSSLLSGVRLNPSAQYTFLYFGRGSVLTRDFQAWVLTATSAGHVFNVVYVSMDRTEEEYAASTVSKPWSAIPYQERGVRERLAVMFNASPPCVVMIDAAGNVVVADAYFRVALEPGLFPWLPKPVEQFVVASLDIGHVATVVLFLDRLQHPSRGEGVLADFSRVAESMWDSGRAHGSDTVRFAVATDDDEVRHYNNILCNTGEHCLYYKRAVFVCRSRSVSVWRVGWAGTETAGGWCSSTCLPVWRTCTTRTPLQSPKTPW